MKLRTLALALALFACKKDAAPAAKETVAIKADDKTSLADKKDAPKVEEKGTPTGALDFELVNRNGTYVLRDVAWEITFPTRPQVESTKVQSPTGSTIPVVTAVGESKGGDGFYGLAVTPFNEAVDVEKGLDGARDKMLENVHGTLVSETKTTLGGLQGRKVIATAQAMGKTVYVDARTLWDPEHRSFISVQTGSLSQSLTKDAEAFYASLVVKPGRTSPLTGAPPDEGKLVPVGVADLGYTRTGESYEVTGAGLKVKFPTRPTIEQEGGLPKGLRAFSAVGYTGARETYTVTGLIVPADTAFDSEKGIQGTLDEIMQLGKFGKPTPVATEIAGRKGKRVVMNGVIDGKESSVEVASVWDEKHRTVFTVIALTDEKQMSAGGRAFLDSLTITD
jgi:hypothetical protein